jgi:hypothetical protein
MRLTTGMFLLLGATAIGSTIFVTSWRTSRPGGTVAGAEPAASGAAGSADLAALQRDVNLLKARSKLPPVVAIAPPAKSEAESRPPDAEAARAVAKEQVRQVTQTLENKYASEPVDAAWSGKRTGDIRAAIVGKDSRTMVASVACATSLCKVVLDHDTREAQAEIAPTLSELEPFRSGVFFSYDESAKPPRTTAYVLREGHDISEVFGAL